MERDQFWLNDRQFARLAPYLPTDTRGKPRVDDRRVISGIVHVLKCGCRWVDAPAVYGPRKTLYNRFVRWAAKGVWMNIFHALAAVGGRADRLLRGQGASLRRRRSRGELSQAIGRSRGGRTTKIHALTDAFCRPLAFMLTGGQVPNCFTAGELLDQLVSADIRHGDKILCRRSRLA